MGRSSLKLAVLFLAPSLCIAQNKITTHVVDTSKAEQIGTAMDHASMITFPEEVTGAHIASDDVNLEYRGNVVLIQPNEPGVHTNLLVFTPHYQFTYDVQPAKLNSELSYVIHEVLPAPPPPPPGPTPAEAERQRDSMHDAFILTMRPIKAPRQSFGEWFNKPDSVSLRIEAVGEDSYSYYLRLSAVNHTSHLYRVSTPLVEHVIPTFGEKMAVSSIDEQLSEAKFHQVIMYDEEVYPSHGSTLIPHDLKPGEGTRWAMAIPKPKHGPAMYEFELPKDGETAIRAVAVF